MDMPIIDSTPEEDFPMSESDSDGEATRPEIKTTSRNKRRHQEVVDGFVYPKKTTKVTAITPTQAPLPTSIRYQDLPPASDPTPKQPTTQPKPTPIHAYTPNYRKLILDLSISIKNPTH